MKKISVLIFSLIILCFKVNAQDKACKDGLYKANNLFESGKFQDVIQILAPCLKNNSFSKDETFNANRLVALSYVYLKDSKNADVYITKMLHLRHDYQKYPYVDPTEFRSLLSQFQVRNTFDFGIDVGLTNNMVRSIKSYSTANTPSTYFSKGGFQLGVLAEYHFTKKVSLLLKPNYNTMNYVREMDNVAGSKKEYSELVVGIEVPLIFRMYFGKGDWKFFGQAGVQWNRVSKSFADVQSTNLLDGSVLQSSTETTDFRNRNLIGFNAGIGASTNLGPGSFSLGLNYRYFMSNLAEPDKRYDNVDFILNAQYIDSDFSIYSMGVNVSYQFPIFHEVKKRHPKL